MNRLQRLHEAGVSIWLETLSRKLLGSGESEQLVREYAVTGATSNPTIFAKAITGSDRYDDPLRAAVAARKSDPREVFFDLGLEDVRRAAGILRPACEASSGQDGLVSFECTPDLADDTGATIEQALELWGRPGLPNVMIKVPATAAGVPAIEERTARSVTAALPRRRTTELATLAGLGIAALDLGVIGRRFGRIRALPQLPRVADHLAYGTTVGAVLSMRRRRRG